MPTSVGWGLLAWVVGIAFFLPVLWMVITAFKPESAADTTTPKFIFSPTLDEFKPVFSGMGPFLTTRCSRRSSPRSWCCCSASPPRSHCRCTRSARRDGLFFFISTKMLPIVAAIVPIYVIARRRTCSTTSGR